MYNKFRVAEAQNMQCVQASCQTVCGVHRLKACRQGFHASSTEGKSCKNPWQDKKESIGWRVRDRNLGRHHSHDNQNTNIDLGVSVLWSWRVLYAR